MCMLGKLMPPHMSLQTLLAQVWLPALGLLEGSGGSVVPLLHRWGNCGGSIILQKGVDQPPQVMLLAVSIRLADTVCTDDFLVLLAGSAGTSDAGGCASHAADRGAALLGAADGRLQLYAWQRHLQVSPLQIAPCISVGYSH